MSPLRLSVLAALTLTLAACGTSSPPNWRNAGGADDGRLRADYSYCKRYADDEAYRKSGAIHGEDISGINSSYSPSAQMAAFDAKRIYKRALDSCMTSRGYVKGKSATSGIDNAVEGVRDKLSW